MVFPVIGGDGKPTGYEIDNSLRMGPSGGSTTPHVNLRRTLGSAGTEEKFTYSCWVKISAKSEYNFWLLGGSQETSGAYQATYLRIRDTDTLQLVDSSPDGTTNIETNRLFRDPSAWYHIVLAVDSTQGTSSNRVKIYVNGVQETSFSTENYPSQNTAFRVLENGVTQSIGTWLADDGSAFACDDGYISEVYLIDGAQKAPTDFGETNDNGVWIPKDYSGTYGTHGFRFEFKQTGSSANSSGIGADTSGNDNHFSVNNSAATDVTTDTPTNNFATLNPLGIGGGTFSEGNCKYVTSGTDSTGALSTIPVGGNLATGKWYCEFKAISKTGNYYNYGVSNVPTGIFSGGANIHSIIYRSDGVIYINGNSNESSLTSISDNNIVGMAYNGDLGKLQFYINGSTVGGLKSIPNTGFEVFFCSASNGGSTQTTEINFGNPPHAISSGNSDANGYGNFEYAVPSGYYSLCTKNLAEYG